VEDQHTDGPRILVVEDNDNIRAMLIDMLSDVGYEVETSADGFTALAAIARRRPALVLTDLIMPRMSGEEFVRHCHASPECTGVPIVLMSARTDLPRVGQNLNEFGVRAVLKKPFEMAALYEIVERVCEAPAATGDALSDVLPEPAFGRKRPGMVE
jgi:CheY-like chemotaxis protein